MEACSACFEQRHVFTQQVLAKVLNQLVCTFEITSSACFFHVIIDLLPFFSQVEQIPLPLLFMRTVIQALSVYPALVSHYSQLY